MDDVATDGSEFIIDSLSGGNCSIQMKSFRNHKAFVNLKCFFGEVLAIMKQSVQESEFNECRLGADILCFSLFHFASSKSFLKMHNVCINWCINRKEFV